MKFNQGDIVLADLGYAAKVRPALVLSAPGFDAERNMTLLAPITSEVRGGKGEVSFPKPQWLARPSVVNLMGLAGVDNARIIRRLGPFPSQSMTAVKNLLTELFDL